MLKFAKTAALVLTASFGINATAHANVEEALANICTIVSADDKGELRKKMRAVQSDYRLKLRDYYSGISCNGQSLIRTALHNRQQPYRSSQHLATRKPLTVGTQGQN